MLSHEPVLLDETITALAPEAGGIYLDATVGLGGHSRAILATAGTELVALDQDPQTLRLSLENLAEYGTRIQGIETNFADFEPRTVLGAEFIGFQGILADLGMSSWQLDNPERGLSWRFTSPLDMRLGTGSMTAADLINYAPEKELARIFHEYGEERHSRRIAHALVERRVKQPFTTTTELAEAITKTIGYGQRIHPATRVFQGLRIAVNDELGCLDRFLLKAPTWLAVGGVLAIISFHSLEDRRVKWAFREQSGLKILTPKPIIPSLAEQKRNPRARSAKLRYARRLEVTHAAVR